MTYTPYLALRERGASLVELMVAMTIGLILSAAAAAVYLQTSKTYNIEDDLSRLQENGRAALDIISRDVRMAGYNGCNGQSITPLINVNTPASYAYNFSTGIQGFYGSGGSWSPAPPADAPVPSSASQSSDVITLRRADSAGMPLTAPFMSSPTAAIPVFPGNGLSVGDIVLLSDCVGAAIFQISGGSPDTGTVLHAAGGAGPGNSTGDVGRVFGSNAELAKVNTVTYFVSPSQFGTGPALWRVIGTQPAEELAENIEQIRILFGVDSDGDQSANSYVPPSPAVNMANVVSVRISLLVRSGNANDATQAQTYFFNGTSVVATDKRIRRAFSATIGLRNRTL